MQTETISYRGTNFIRYPESKNRTERVYYSGWVKINGVQKKIRLHVYKYMCEVGEIPKGYHIHHKNEDTLDNKTDNFELLTHKKHISDHVTKWNRENREFVLSHLDKIRPKTVEWHQSEEGRKWHSENQKTAWSKKEFRVETCQQCGKEYKTKAIQPTKYCHQNCRATALRRRRGVRPINK